MSAVLPCLSSPASPVSELGSLGDPLLDAYLEFVSARSRPNTVLATWFDLKVFFGVVGKPVAAVRPVDVLGFISAQRAGRPSLPEPQLLPVIASADYVGCRYGRSGVGSRRSPACMASWLRVVT